MSRRTLVAGNWKMNKTPSEAKALIESFKGHTEAENVDVLCCVPAIDIIPAMEAAEGTNIVIGAENMYFEDSGAYTGEISPAMLKDAGVKYVILGHSERREYFGETDITVNKKMHKAHEYGIIPIMCCGETLDEREMGVTLDIIRRQVKIGFLNISLEDALNSVIAYEPIWAIGTGRTATADQAEEVCAAIRETICGLYGEDAASKIRILYGGSVNGGNAAELFAKEDIDGGLIGGAALKDDFLNIINYK